MTARRLATVCTYLGFTGLWMPDSWNTPRKRILYSTYSALVWIVLYSWTVSQILDLIIRVKTLEEFTDTIYAIMANVCMCAKFTNVLLTREQIRKMIDRIEKEPFAALSVEEEEIRTRFDRQARRNTFTYTLVLGCYVLPCTTALIVGFRDHKLLSRAWLPYDWSSNVWFNITLIHQFGAQFCAGCITTGSDCLFNGFLMHTYCHFEILKHRLKMIVADKKYTLKRCSYLHDHIYTLVALLFHSVYIVQQAGFNYQPQIELLSS